MPASKPTNHYDTVIIGAGVLGLWAARYVIGEGRSVCVIDRGQVGAGASGGILGALMSHVPGDWNIKKEFQFHALDGLEGELQQLTRETGIETGYRRCGRVMPLVHEGMISNVEKWVVDARTNWHGRYKMQFLEPGNEWFTQNQWPGPDLAPFGASYDELAARCAPRGVVAALGKFAKVNGQVLENVEVTSVSPDNNEVQLQDGTKISAGEIIVANGVDAYRLLHPFMGSLNDDAPLGRGVNGQAVMIEFTHEDTLPILYQDGVYIVPHGQNCMAIGSTSRNIPLDQLDENSTKFNADDMAFYEKAMALAPILKDAPIVERWAGVRPRNTLKGRGADPWFEPVPGHENLIALIGGFKITFAIAHKAMDVARGKIEGPRRQKLSWVQ